jgi:hypothetical protein
MASHPPAHRFLESIEARQGDPEAATAFAITAVDHHQPRKSATGSSEIR